MESLTGAIQSIELWHARQPSWLKHILTGAFIASVGGTLYRLVQAYMGTASPSPWEMFVSLLDLLSIPWRWALSLIGEVFGFLGFDKFELVTDHLVDDWSGGGLKQGVGGEALAMLGNIFKAAPPAGMQHSDTGVGYVRT